MLSTRGLAWIVAAGLACCLFAALSSVSPAFERDPATGGMIGAPWLEAPAPAAQRPIPVPDATPVPTPSPAREPAQVYDPPPGFDAAPATAATTFDAGDEDDTTWGVVLRGGYFGLMDEVADSLFRQHPEIAGTSYGVEYRYHGEGGGRGWVSSGLTFDYCTVSADGIWQSDETHAPEAGGGDIRLLAATLTGYLSLFPSWYLHPYLGVGIGAGYAEGSYREGTELVKVWYVVPVLHVPVGLAVELDERLQLALETRFLDGLSFGGSLQLRF